jgi:hypothetical protein
VVQKFFATEPENLNKAIAHWQEDLDDYRELIESQFLAGVEIETVSLFSTSAR